MLLKDLIKRLRIKLDVSQKGLANLLKITQRDVCSYESGTVVPHLRTVAKIVNFAKMNGINIEINEISTDDSN